MEERPDLDEIVENLSEPLDITSYLEEDVQETYAEFGAKLFALSLDCLILNVQNFSQSENVHRYIVFGKYNYYSPEEMSYDFTHDDPKKHSFKVNLTSPAMISKANQRLLFYIHNELLSSKEKELILKSYYETSRNDVEPTLIINPTFMTNSSPKTRQLVELILINHDGIELLDGTQFSTKYSP